MGEECLMHYKSLIKIMGFKDQGMEKIHTEDRVETQRIILIGNIIATKSIQPAINTKVIIDGMTVTREKMLGSMRGILGIPNFREVGLKIRKLRVHWHEHLILVTLDGSIQNI